jgi:hypothetical protein
MSSLARQFAPGSDRPVAARLRLDAAIYDSAACHNLRKEAGETPQTTEVIGIDRSTGLDLESDSECGVGWLIGQT